MPTALRTSSLSLLAQCASTNPLALIPYTNELLNSMTDLLQVESVASKPPGPKDTGDNKKEKERPTLDSQPTTADSKLPPLRRAALYLLTLFLKSYAEQALEDGSKALLLPQLDRAKYTVAYVSSTDEDMVARVMATELLETIAEFDRGILVAQ